jgi:hypothetical protein
VLFQTESKFSLENREWGRKLNGNIQGTRYSLAGFVSDVTGKITVFKLDSCTMVVLTLNSVNKGRLL